MVQSAAQPSPTIVIVASDAGLRRALRFLLQAEGHAVESLDSAEALIGLDPGRADCLIVDQDLSGMTGLEALGRLEPRRRTPTVLLASEADGSLREAARRTGVELVGKPFHGAQLLAAVRVALGG